MDVIIAILDVANGNEVKQADILIKVNISYHLFREYLFYMNRFGLIDVKYKNYCKVYLNYCKGNPILSVCNKMKSLMLP
jgi:predicted transcriptional regulator